MHQNSPVLDYLLKTRSFRSGDYIRSPSASKQARAFSFDGFPGQPDTGSNEIIWVYQRRSIASMYFVEMVRLKTICFISTILILYKQA
jgi:hypothetical protein